MYENILVPLDGSDFSENALPTALALAERTGARLQLVSVVTTAPTVRVLSSEEREQAEVKGWFEERSQSTKAYLGSVRDRLAKAAGDGVEVNEKVLSGPPVEAVDERARKVGADLIVMTTHGRGPLGRAWLGSVADGLIRTGPCPVLLERPQGDGAPDLGRRPELGRVLVPMDGSERSASVIPGAVAVSRAFGGAVTLFSMIPADESVGAAHTVALPFDRAVPLGEAVEAMNQRLEKLAADARRDTDVVIHHEVVTGHDPVEAIGEARRRLGAQLIALSTRGHGGVPRMLLGSVADKIIRGGGCPVLIHRPPEGTGG